MRELAALPWLSLALACAPQSEPPAAAAEPVEHVVAAPPIAAAAVASCPLVATPQPLALRAAVDLGEHAGKRWLVGLDDERRAVLLHLGRAGELVRTPLPRWSEYVAAEGPTRLRMISGDGGRWWWTIDLREPDAPVVSPATPIAGLPADGEIKGVASDGARALVSLYRAAPAGSPSAWKGDTYLLDVASGQVIGGPAPATVWAATCARGRCYGWASPNADDDTRVLLALADDGHRTVAQLGRSQCSGAAFWHDGGRWTIATSDRGAVQIAALDLASEAVQRAEVPAPGPDCAEPSHLELGGQHGLLRQGPRSLVFVALGPDLKPGPPEPLPPMLHTRQRFTSFADAVLAADHETSTRRVDDGTDPQGHHEWHDEASFRGRHGLLRRGAGWSWLPGGPLPGDGETDTLGIADEPRFITRPGHAGVLMLGDAGARATYLPLRGPCP